MLCGCANHAQNDNNQKRAPLYNTKYIKKAKSNIKKSNINEYDLQGNNTKIKNQLAYIKMLEEEKYKKTQSKKIERGENEYNKLKSELSDIRKILNDTKRELSNYKCPNPERLEREFNEQFNNTHYRKNKFREM
jgi:hypothetical protein